MGVQSLVDVINIVGQMQRQLGHQVVWDPENDEKVRTGQINHFIQPALGYNVIVEGFTRSIIDVIAGLHGQGVRFICLATEEPTAKGFNHGTQKEMTARQAIFPEAMKYFDAIMHLVPGKHITEWYGQFAPSAYVELGYSPNLVRPMHVAEPEYDFGFFGSLTPRRLKLLQKLARYVGGEKAIRIVSDFAEPEKRDRVMQNSKVIIQVRKFEEMGLVSSSRCCTALYNGRPVIAERHDPELSKPWDEIVSFADNEAAFFLAAWLARNNWRQLHEEQFSRFQAKLSADIACGQAMAKLNLQGLLARAA
jgi:hypothetical protein